MFKTKITVKLLKDFLRRKNYKKLELFLYQLKIINKNNILPLEFRVLMSSLLQKTLKNDFFHAYKPKMRLAPSGGALPKEASFAPYIYKGQRGLKGMTGLRAMRMTDQSSRRGLTHTQMRSTCKTIDASHSGSASQLIGVVSKYLRFQPKGYSWLFSYKDLQISKDAPRLRGLRDSTYNHTLQDLFAFGLRLTAGSPLRPNGVITTVSKNPRRGQSIHNLFRTDTLVNGNHRYKVSLGQNKGRINPKGVKRSLLLSNEASSAASVLFHIHSSSLLHSTGYRPFVFYSDSVLNESQDVTKHSGSEERESRLRRSAGFRRDISHISTPASRIPELLHLENIAKYQLHGAVSDTNPLGFGSQNYFLTANTTSLQRNPHSKHPHTEAQTHEARPSKNAKSLNAVDAQSVSRILNTCEANSLGVCFASLTIESLALETRQKKYCLLTGRSKGVLKSFGISRMAFRKLADKGFIPGVRKSSW